MMWGALMIPVLVVLFLFFYFRPQLAWWEPFVCFLPTVAMVALFVLGADGLQTSDTEWLTDLTARIEHHEEYTRQWREWVPEQSHYVTDSKGRTRKVVTRHAHYETRTQHYPEKWLKITPTGRKFNVSKGEYNRVKRVWSQCKEIYTDLHHPDQRHGLFDGRGDMFHVTWPHSDETVEPITWTQTYENRIQASQSVFKFPPVDKEKIKTLYNLPRPDSNHLTPAILGDGGPTTAEANKKLMVWNTKIGPRPGVNNQYKYAGRLWILIFRNRPQQDAVDQESYWQGGNKNEMTLCIGLDNDNKVKWAHVISWTRNERLKVDIRAFAMNQDLVDLNAIVDYMGRECFVRFERREFAEFSYLTVQPPTWAIVTTWFVTLLVNGGIAVFCICNPFTANNPAGEHQRPTWNRMPTPVFQFPRRKY